MSVGRSDEIKPLEELDLTVEEPEQSRHPKPLETYDVQPYEIVKMRENSRQKIAYIVLGLLGGVVLAAFVSAVLPTATSVRLDAAIDMAFPPLLGLAGTVIGFYFGAGMAQNSQGA